MRKAFVITACTIMIPMASARADEPIPQTRVAFPGSFWMAAGDIGPAERENEVVQGAFEQGITLWNRDAWYVVPFVGVTFSADTLGYDWNNKRPVTVGMKVVRRLPGGVLQVGGGVNFERTPGTDHRRHATGSASYWAGWKADRWGSPGSPFRTFPGHVYVASGTLTGRDPENWITTASAQQGVVAYRSRAFAVVPYVGASAGIDSKGRPWENRATYDGGVKIVRPVVGGVIEAGAAQRHQRQWKTGTSGNAPVLYVNLWLGWNPRTVSTR